MYIYKEFFKNYIPFQFHTYLQYTYIHTCVKMLNQGFHIVYEQLVLNCLRVSIKIFYDNAMQNLTFQ